MMPTDQYDRFLDDATHAVADLWKGAAPPLDADELMELNDLLDGFFTEKRGDDGNG